MIRIRRITANDFKQLQSVDLHLPSTGRFLIQGKNEAGKSTLFEALYFGLFGRGLVGRNMDDLIGYAREKARVEVWVEARGSLYKIERTITRGRPQSAYLTIDTPGRPTEEIRSATAVTQRIARELGVDGDALLNTCFVEQKKLDKLEGLEKDKREGSLMRLLNLDQLKTLEDKFKVVAEDRQKLRYASDRLELARARDQLPACEDELDGVQKRLTLAQARQHLAHALAAHADISSLDAEIDTLVLKERELSQRNQQVSAIRATQQTLREMGEVCDQVAAEQRVRADNAQALAAARDAGEQVMGEEQRARALRRLADRFTRLNAIARRHDSARLAADELTRAAATLRDDVREWEVARDRAAELETALADADSTLAAALGAVDAWHIRAALTDWTDAYATVTAPTRAASQLAEREAEREALHAQFRAEVEQALADLPRTLAAALTVLAVALWRLWMLFQQLDAVAYTIGHLEGSQETLQRHAEASRERLDAAARALASLGEPVPVDDTAASARLEALAAIVGDSDRPTLQAAADAARERLADLRGELSRVTQRRTQFERKIRGQNVAAAEADAARQQTIADKARRIDERWRPRAAAALSSLGIPRAALERECGKAEQTIQSLRRTVATIPSLERKVAANESRLRDLSQRLAGLHAAVAQSEPDIPPLDPALSRDTLRPFFQGLTQRLKDLGADEVDKNLRAATDALAAARASRDDRSQRLDESLAEAQTLLRRAGEGALLANHDIDIARAVHTELVALGGDLGPLEAKRAELERKIGSLRARRDDLERQLGLGDSPLDLDECLSEHKALERQHAVRERARRMVVTARQRVFEKIMPDTMRHMQSILPDLTSGRYMHAQLTPDYKILVLDERAGDAGEYRQKDIFSGGTRDQLSLALRLSFALATLPSERGTAPSFIFLDEPLGAFDDERAEALLRLLTEGEIGDAFHQIFLISHVRIDESQFTYHIRLEGGRVVSHDLPDPVDADTVHEPQLALGG